MKYLSMDVPRPLSGARESRESYTIHDNDPDYIAATGVGARGDDEALPTPVPKKKEKVKPKAKAK